MKVCRRCSIEKPLSGYYKHKQMGDGHLNICIECKKIETSQWIKEKEKDPNWLEKERERGRLKYHRLYIGKYKQSKEIKFKSLVKFRLKYPEKKKAHAKTARMKASVKGNHLHHWSYNDDHLKDVIELSVLDHNLVHRKTVYDQERKMYRRSDNLELLDTKEACIKYYKQIGVNPF